MINILLTSSLFWLSALLVYYFGLKKLTFHHLNRWYLLMSLLIGAALPFIPVNDLQDEPLTVYLNPVVIQLNHVATNINQQVTMEQFDYWYAIGVLYIIGVLFHLYNLIKGVLKLRQQAKEATIVSQSGVSVVYSDEVQQPFSFWKWVFVPSKSDLHTIVLNHEYAHIKGGHSWDKLVLQLIAALYWVVPIFIFYRRFINEVHEYIADGYVLQQTSKKEYSYFLLGQTGQGRTPLLSNNFHSLIKNRITMILKKETNTYNRIWYLPVMMLVLGLAATILISCNNEPAVGADVVPEADAIAKLYTFADTIITFNPETYEESMKVVKTEMEVYDELDQMPIFSLAGCESIADLTEKDDCATHNLMTFIYTNIKYPKEMDKEGVVVLKFVVTDEGYARQPEIVRTIGDNYSKEVMAMFNKMSDHQWIPGKLDGENKNVFFNLPIKFKLEG